MAVLLNEQSDDLTRTEKATDDIISHLTAKVNCLSLILLTELCS